MLCQKCGRQKVAVHLKTVVYRQLIEEHLCGLCAGIRAFTASEDAEPVVECTPAASIDGPDPDPPAAVPGSFGETIRALIRLSKEQGYLTFDNINEALLKSAGDKDETDNVLSVLHNLEIAIIEPAPRDGPPLFE